MKQKNMNLVCPSSGLLWCLLQSYIVWKWTCELNKVGGFSNVLRSGYHIEVYKAASTLALPQLYIHTLGFMAATSVFNLPSKSGASFVSCILFANESCILNIYACESQHISYIVLHPISLNHFYFIHVFLPRPTL